MKSTCLRCVAPAAASALLIIPLVLKPAFAAGEAPKSPTPKGAPVLAPAAAGAKPDEAHKATPAAKKKEEAPKKEEAKPAEPVIHKVKRGEFELKVELDGVFEGVESTPVSLDPKEWGDLTIVSVVEHGVSVKKGEVLARLEAEKLEEAIADLERARPAEELALNLAKLELAALEKTTPLSLETARRAKTEGEQDLAYFEDTAKALRERDAREDVKRIEQNLSYSREELNQLEKMYKADDLTEETEEIILQRAKNEVAYLEWLLDSTRKRSERTLTTGIPRDHKTQQQAVQALDIAWRQAEQGLPGTLRKKQLEVAAQEVARKKAEEKLADLKADLATLTVRAPHDGIVYYGASSRGKWITASTVDRKLVPGGKLLPHEVMFTIVKPGALRIRAAIPENRLRHLHQGLTGIGAPSWDAEAEFPTTLERLSLVPFADNTYDALFSVAKAEPGAPVLNPGMNAKIRLDLYSAEKALTAPRKAVHRDAGGYYVHLKDGTKRPVKVGKYNDDAYEIIDGLKEGDEIKNP